MSWTGRPPTVQNMCKVARIALILACVLAAGCPGGPAGGGQDAGELPPDAGSVCGDAGTDERGESTSEGWCWENPTPQGRWLNSVWGSGPDDVWAVGRNGTILHWDGSRWSLLDSGTLSDLRAVWGSGPDDVWVIGWSGTVIHWDGGGWSNVDVGTAQYWDGIWGTGPDDIWLVAGCGPVLHWDGFGWITFDIDGDECLLGGIWGSGPDDVWAAGAHGTMFHWDGIQWTPHATSGWNLHTVWGSGPDDVWVSGGDGFCGECARPVLMHWNGLGWEQVLPGQGGDYPPATFGIWGSSADDVWLVGGSFYGIAHWDGSSMAVVPLPEFGSWLKGVWGSAANDVWAVGGGGDIWHWDGQNWTRFSSGFRDGIYSIWGTCPNDVWATGFYGAILHRDESGWTVVEPDGVHRETYLDVWGSAPDDVWFVGRQQILHWNGHTWRGFRTDSRHGLNAVWGSGRNSVWAVGDDGLILHWDGGNWSVARSADQTHSRLTDVSGTGPHDVWAVGGWTVLHWQGWQWNRIPADPPGSLEAVWNSGPTDVWVVGRTVNNAEGIIGHWDGASWNFLQVPNRLGSLWGRGPDDVWAAGITREHDGSLYHWDGNNWTEPFETDWYVSALWGTSEHLWAGGQDGCIVRRRLP